MRISKKIDLLRREQEEYAQAILALLVAGHTSIPDPVDRAKAVIEEAKANAAR